MGSERDLGAFVPGVPGVDHGPGVGPGFTFGFWGARWGRFAIRGAGYELQPEKLANRDRLLWLIVDSSHFNHVLHS